MFALKISQEKIEGKEKFYDMKMPKGSQSKTPNKLGKKRKKKRYQFYLLGEIN